MKTLAIPDELDEALEDVSARMGRDKAQVAGDVLRRYIRAEKLRYSLEDPSLAALYQELAAEDVALAEEGMADYAEALAAADRQ